MKKIVLRSILVFMFGYIFCMPKANALDWYTANQKTVAWTPVTTNTDGSEILDGSIVKYQSYLVNAIEDPNKQSPIDTGITAIPEKTFTLPAEGKFYAGIRSLRYVGDELVSQSKTISWSDDPLVCKDGKTFGLKFYLIPDAAVDMYPKTE